MQVINGGFSIDDRGRVTFINDFDLKDVKRLYVVENHFKGYVRAWHGHKKEGKYVFVVTGAVIVGVVPLKGKKPPEKYVLSDLLPRILYIPPGHANGFKTLAEDSKVIFFSTLTLEESQKDDIRYPADKWNIWGITAR